MSVTTHKDAVGGVIGFGFSVWHDMHGPQHTDDLTADHHTASTIRLKDAFAKRRLATAHDNLEHGPLPGIGEAAGIKVPFSF